MNDTTRNAATGRRLEHVTVFDDPIDLLSYRRDCSVVKPGTAEVAAQPANTDDVVAVVADAVHASRPVYVRGGGTMYVDCGAANKTLVERVETLGNRDS